MRQLVKQFAGGRYCVDRSEIDRFRNVKLMTCFADLKLNRIFKGFVSGNNEIRIKSLYVEKLDIFRTNG